MKRPTGQAQLKLAVSRHSTDWTHDTMTVVDVHVR